MQLQYSVVFFTDFLGKNFKRFKVFVLKMRCCSKASKYFRQVKLSYC